MNIHKIIVLLIKDIFKIFIYGLMVNILLLLLFFLKIYILWIFLLEILFFFIIVISY